MAEDNDDTISTRQQLIPTIVSLRDAFLVMTTIVSIMIAWGVYGTRLSVIEERMVSSKQHIVEIRELIKEMREDVVVDHGKKYARIYLKMEHIDDRLREVENSFIRINGLIDHHHK